MTPQRPNQFPDSGPSTQAMSAIHPSEWYRQFASPTADLSEARELEGFGLNPSAANGTGDEAA